MRKSSNNPLTPYQVGFVTMVPLGSEEVFLGYQAELVEPLLGTDILVKVMASLGGLGQTRW